MVFIFRKIVILTFAGCGFWLSYKLYTWQDSDKNSWLSAAANGSLDPAGKNDILDLSKLMSDHFLSS